MERRGGKEARIQEKRKERLKRGKDTREEEGKIEEKRRQENK